MSPIPTAPAPAISRSEGDPDPAPQGADGRPPAGDSVDAVLRRARRRALPPQNKRAAASALEGDRAPAVISAVRTWPVESCTKQPERSRTALDVGEEKEARDDWDTLPTVPRGLSERTTRWGNRALPLAVGALLCVLLVAVSWWRFAPEAGREVIGTRTEIPAQQASVAGGQRSGAHDRHSATAPAEPHVKGQPAGEDSGPSDSATVDIDGAVARPGVYSLASGSRVSELLEAAGGASPDADLSRVNRAMKVSDGQKIYIPRKGEELPASVGPEKTDTASASASGESGAEAGSRVRVNLAQAQELTRLPKVGPVLAQRIVEERARNGPFHDLEDLGRVKGLGPSVLSTLADRVSFER